MGVAISEIDVTLHINLLELCKWIDLNAMFKHHLYLKTGNQMPW